MINKYSIFTLAVLSAATLELSNAAHASTTGTVSSPVVTKGEKEVSVRAGYSLSDDNPGDDDRFRSRAHFKYGFTDYYAAQIVVSQDKRQGDSYEHDSLKFENRFQLIDKADHGFDMGIHVNYQLKDGDKKPDSAEIVWLNRIPYDKYELRLNPAITHEVGQDAESGVNFETRFQVTAAVMDNTRLGIEGFHDFGNLRTDAGWDEQSHTIGPVIKGKFLDGYSYEAGYRAGISDAAPDHNFKIFLAKSF